MSYFDNAKELISDALRYRSEAFEFQNTIDKLKGQLRRTRHPRKHKALTNDIRVLRTMRSKQLERANEAKAKRNSFVTTIGSL